MILKNIKAAACAFGAGFRTGFHLLELLDHDSRFNEPELLKRLSSARISWAFFNNIHGTKDTGIRRHRGLSVKDRQQVTGYLWAGNNAVYIIPDTCGVYYDKNTGKLTTMAVEVDRKSVSVESTFWDDRGTTLFEGDTVRFGDEEFTFRMSDPETLKILTSPDRKTKGLYRVRTNCDPA